MKPFEQHTALLEQTELLRGGGQILGGAVLYIFGTRIPCTHTEIVKDFTFEIGGQSSTTFIERMEFRRCLVGSAVPGKGLRVTLWPNPKSPPFKMQLWHGGLEPGGEVYRFMLVDANYKA